MEENQIKVINDFPNCLEEENTIFEESKIK